MHRVHKWCVVLGGLVSGGLGAALYLLVNCWSVREGYVDALLQYYIICFMNRCFGDVIVYGLYIVELRVVGRA